MNKMCISDNKSAPHEKSFILKEARTGLVERSRSQTSSISRDLRKSFEASDKGNKQNKSSSCSIRISLDEDIKLVKKSSSVRNRGSRHSSNFIDKENIVPGRKSRKSSGQSTPGVFLRDTNVFKFSLIEQDAIIPRISVGQEDEDNIEQDDVFIEDSIESHELPNTLLLTPSTASSVRRSSCSSLGPYSYLEGPSSSPSVSRGISCNTPDKIRLESSGLGLEKLVLGRGAYGTVVLGRWMGKKVAIKVMEKEEGNESNRRRKSLEGELNASNMNHENIVKIHDVRAAEKKYAIIIMEYVGSRNLHRLLSTPEKLLPTRWLLGCGLQVASALKHCHSRGVVHLDVKPANILVTSTGQCKLGDFGCSVSLGCPTLEVDNSLVGTPGYQAPEFLRGILPTPACDIYALGITLWQLDSREIPFQGVHAQTVMFQVVSAGVRPVPPPRHLAYVNRRDFSLLYNRCWAQESSQRPSAAKLDEELYRIVKMLDPANVIKVTADSSGQTKIDVKCSDSVKTIKTSVNNVTLKPPNQKVSKLRI